MPENGDVLSFTDANSGSIEEEVMIQTNETSTSAMICALEHIVPNTKVSSSINQKVGGLGKVMEIVARFHPGPLVMVTPMVGSESYPAMREAQPIDCVIDGTVERVRIFHYIWPQSDSQKKVESIFCKHDGIFGVRSVKATDLYPNNDRDLNHFLTFFALWSQTVAKLVLRHREQLDVLHLCDYHTAFAPAYVKSYGGSIPVLCTLHNASYQGNLSKHILGECPLALISSVTGIERELILSKFTLDGDFNMLSGLISYFRDYQNGHGFCAVSKNYANEVPVLLDNFRVGQVYVKSLPNPELKTNRPTSLYNTKNVEELRLIKRQKKHELQVALGLNVDPDAMIAAFVGRLVVQKGVDAIADIASEMLSKHKKLQLIVVGPVGDVFGRYASCRLENIAREKKFRKRIFFTPKFFRFTPDYRLGCDFTLMPSRCEPFGFVDIEFAWAGCPCVGSLVGGLGKVPGWYFKIWNAEHKHLRIQLSRTIDKVMEQGHEKVLKLGAEAICTSFPVIKWQKQLNELYQNVMKSSKLSSSMEITTDFPTERNSLWVLHKDAHLFLVRHGKFEDKIRSTINSKTYSVSSQCEGLEQKKPPQKLKGDASADAKTVGKRGVQQIDSKACTIKKSKSESFIGKFPSYGAVDLEKGISRKQSLDDIYEKLEANISQEMKMGKKTNINTVLKSVDWGESRWITPATLVRPCEKLLNKEIADRSVESWIIAFLSILMPGYSTLLYAKSIAWATTNHWDDNQIGGIYTAHFLAFAVACLIWPQILKRVSVGFCVSTSSLLHVISISYFTYASNSDYYTALLLAVAMGLVSSANGPVFTAALFFDELDGTLVSKMRKYGFIEGLKTIFTGFLQGIIVYDLLSLPYEEKQSVSLTSSFSLLIIYGIIASLTIIGSILLFLGMRRNLQTAFLPEVSLSSVFSFKAFFWLSLSTIIEGIISYPTLFLLSWLLLDGFGPKEVGIWFARSSLFIGFGIFYFAILFTKFREAPKCVSALVTLFANPVPLQALVMMAAPSMSAETVLVLLCITSFLIKLREGLISVLKLHVLNSRWKVVTFSCYELFLSNITSAASPFIVKRIANSMNLSVDAVGPGASSEAAAAAILYIVSPIAVISLILQLIANKYAFLDISDIYTKVDWTAKE